MSVLNILHCRESAVLLVKAALRLENAQPLYKGDVAGHEFHGNQHTGGMGGQAALNNLGATGGFSYNPLTGEVPTTGFMVSTYPERSFAVQAKDFKPSVLEKYVKDNKDLLEKSDHFVGGWFDESTGMHCLDISVRASSHTEATKLSVDHDQKGYFANETKQYHEVNANATSGGVLKGDVNVKSATENLRKDRPERPSEGDRFPVRGYESARGSFQQEKSRQEKTANLIKVALSPDNGVSLYKGVR